MNSGSIIQALSPKTDAGSCCLDVSTVGFISVFGKEHRFFYLETAFSLLCSPRTPLSLCYGEVGLVMDAGRGQHHHGVNASSASLPSLEKGKYLAVIAIRKNKNRLKPIFGAVHATAQPQHAVPLHECLTHG